MPEWRRSGIHVTEKLLNHVVSGTLFGLTTVYNRHAYKDEAVAAWEAKLSRLLEERAPRI